MAREHELLFRINAQMGSSYQATFREATAAMGSLRDEYNALANTAKDIAAYQRQAQAVENTKAKLELLQQQYANIQREINETGGFSSDLENKLASKQHQIDKTTEALQNQTDKLGEYEAALQQAGVDTSNLDDESKRLASEMDDLRKGFDDAAQGADEMGASATDALMDLEGVLVGLGIVQMAKELADQLKTCATASMEFEVGMAAVRRTVGGTEEEMAALGDEFQEMAAVMPITTSELTDIATTAGQLGIAKENVKQFTQVMAELATTTDLSADNAATLLAQFSNITGTSDYDRLGSTVAALGDSTATTASRIVQMSQGMAAAATVAGMTAQDVLGISAAVGALGGRVQTGATAMAQLITKLYLAIETGEDLDGYAQAAGMTAQEFKRAWGEDAAGALNTFIQGLNDTERNGKSAIAVLNDLGITNARQLRVFTGLANSGDLLTRTIDLANTSWSENTALQEKASIMYDTTKAKMTTMQNQFNNLRIAIGDQFNPALGRLYEMLGDIAGGFAKFAEENPEVVRALGATAVALTTVTVGIGAATVAIKAFDLVAKTTFGPVGWIMMGVSAVAALVAGLGTLALTADHSDDALYNVTAAIHDMNNAVEDANRQVADAQSDALAAAMTAEMYINRLESLEDAGTATNVSQREYRAILSEINSLMPGINIQLDEQTGLVENGASSLRGLAESWKEAAVMQAYYNSYSEKAQAWAKLRIEVEDAETRLNTVREQNAGLLGDIEQKERALSLVQAKRNALTLDSVGSTELFMQMQSEYDEQIAQLQNDIYLLYSNMTDEQREAMVEQENLSAAVRDGRAALNQYAGEMDELEGKMSAFSDGTDENADSLTNLLAPIDDVLSGIDALAEAYNDAYEDAQKSVLGQMSLWDEAPEVVTSSTDEIINALEAQTEYWTNYSDNLENLTSRNIDGLDAMLQSFADGSEESVNFIATLASASDEELENIVAQWETLGTAQEDIIGGLAGLKSDFDNAMRGMVDSAKNAVNDMKLSYEARQAAIQTLNAYIAAADDKVGEVRAAYAAVASAARDALDYGSMTVITRTNGENIGRVGYAEGTDYATPGWHWVGEKGPEPVYFTGGEKVVSHTKAVELLQNVGGNQQTINVTLAPSYQISGNADATNIRAILEEHDRQLPEKVTAILREAERDAVRRSYS